MAEKKVVVGVYENELEAEIAIGHLEAGGVDASLIKDDAGGMFPSLQQTRGVQVLVSEGDRTKAEGLLKEKMR